MDSIVIVSLLLLTGATGFAIGALFGVLLGRVGSRQSVQAV